MSQDWIDFLVGCLQFTGGVAFAGVLLWLGGYWSRE